MRRVLGWSAFAALWFLLGPWVLVAGLLALLLPAVRRAARPRHPWWTLAGVVLVVGAVIGALVLVPAGRMPVPPGAGGFAVPAYQGSVARPQPVALDVPQHPQLAPNGTSSMHEDAWASDAHPGPGPLGRDPEVSSRWLRSECATLAFDSRARMVALCGDLRGPVLRMLDPDPLRVLASRRLPDRPESDKRPWEDLCAGAYFYLDQDDTAVVATTDRRILEFSTSDRSGGAELRQTRALDVSGAVPREDCVIALMPDRVGQVWFVTQDGRAGWVDRSSGRTQVLDLGEEIFNSVAVDEGGVFVVTVSALWKLAPGPKAPRVLWRSPYDRGSRAKPGQLSRGSGTTPTVLPGGRVVITDNAEPRMNVRFLDAATGQEICRAPVFGAGASATENSLVAAGSGVVVENNYGYTGPLRTVLGRAPVGGLARVDLEGERCRVRWTSTEIAPTSVPKLSLDTGLVYVYTKRRTWTGVAAWYLTAVDVRTGRTAFRVRTGIGALFNNHYAAVTLGPDGAAYVATLMGMVRIADRPVD